MKKLLPLLSLLLILPFSNVMAQKEFNVNGVIVPRTLEFKSRELSLNGVGQRSKMFTELYVQALYLSQLSQDAQFIIDSDSEMAIRIQITSGLVSSKKLSKALEKGIEKSVGPQGFLKLSDKLLQLETIIGREETKKGDAYNLIYSPIDAAILIYKNNRYDGKIEGFEFKKAFFGIWLAENPVDKILKDDLLGRHK